MLFTTRNICFYIFNLIVDLKLNVEAYFLISLLSLAIWEFSKLPGNQEDTSV